MYDYAVDIKSLHIITEIVGFCDVAPEMKINLVQTFPIFNVTLNQQNSRQKQVDNYKGKYPKLKNLTTPWLHKCVHSFIMGAVTVFCVYIHIKNHTTAISENDSD